MKKVIRGLRYVRAQRTLFLAAVIVSVFGLAACSSDIANEKVQATNRQLSIVLDEIEEMYVEAFRVRDEMERVSREKKHLIPALDRFDDVLQRHGVLAREARQRVSALGTGDRARSIEFKALLSERDMMSDGYRTVGRFLADLEPPEQHFRDVIHQMLSR